MKFFRRRPISLKKFFAGVLLLFLLVLCVETTFVIVSRVHSRLQFFDEESQTFMRVASFLIRRQVLHGSEYVYSVLREESGDQQNDSVPIVAVLSSKTVLRSLRGWLPQGLRLPDELLGAQWQVSDILDADGYPLLTGTMYVDGKEVFVGIRLDFSVMDFAGAQSSLPIVTTNTGRILWTGIGENVSELAAHVKARGMVLRSDAVPSHSGWFPFKSYSGQWLYTRLNSFVYGLRMLQVYPVSLLLLSASSGIIAVSSLTLIGLLTLVVLWLAWTKGVYREMSRIGVILTDVAASIEKLDVKDYMPGKSALSILADRLIGMKEPFIAEMIPFVESLRNLALLISRQHRELGVFSNRLQKMNLELTDLNERLRTREKFWEQLLDLSHSFSMSSDIQGTLQGTLDRVREDTGAFGALIITAKNGCYRNIASSGYNDELEDFCLPRDEVAATESLRTSEPLWVEEISKHPGATAVHPDVKSELLVPIFQRGEEEGVLEVSFDRVTEKDPFVIETIIPVASFLGGLMDGSKKRQEIRDSYAYLADKLQFVTGIYHDETEEHIARIGAYSRVLAAEIGRSREEQDEIALFARLHDIGKLKVPNEILSKPGKLTTEEFAVIKKHPEWGAEILGDAPWLTMARNICLTHHERWDGRGYPKGLKGDEIPWEGQVVAIADVYDALRSKRAYKGPYSHEEAVDIIVESTEGPDSAHFSPKMIEAFLRVADRLAALFDATMDE